MKESNATPTVYVAYAFLSDGDEIETREAFEAAGDGAIELLAVRDNMSKGIDENEFSVDLVVEDVKWLGYTKVKLKSDNELGIIKLLSEAPEENGINGVSQAECTAHSRTALRR